MTNETRWTNTKFGGYHINQPLEEDVNLTHIGPGTPFGEYMRSLLQPVAQTS